MMASIIVAQSVAYDSKLGLADRFEHLVFEGGQEFHDPSPWDSGNTLS